MNLEVMATLIGLLSMIMFVIVCYVIRLIMENIR